MLKCIYVLVFVLLFSVSTYSQIAFPITVQVVWDLHPTTDNITSYTVTHNGISQNTTPAVACTATECARSIVLSNEGPHVVAVTATNMWGTSQPTQITFTARSPGRSNNIRIRVN